MRKHQYKGIYLITICFFLISSYSFAQFTVTGPTCVRAGLEYHYVIQGSSAARICVEGGIVQDSLNNCFSISSSAVLIIKWKSTNSTGKIKLSSAQENKTFSITINSGLFPGYIKESSRSQVITENNIPGSIFCGLATEGNCNPAYTYQWQRSIDKVIWEDIPAAAKADLSFASAVSVPTYYRRKVTETGSATIAYSDIASVFINPRPR